MGALRGKWMIYGPRGRGICGGYNLQVGYIGEEENKYMKKTNILVLYQFYMIKS